MRDKSAAQACVEHSNPPASSSPVTADEAGKTLELQTGDRLVVKGKQNSFVIEVADGPHDTQRQS